MDIFFGPPGTRKVTLPKPPRFFTMIRPAPWRKMPLLVGKTEQIFLLYTKLTKKLHKSLDLKWLSVLLDTRTSSTTRACACTSTRTVK